jgi:GPH family glycoside/pentoside/hexuronide:cation symporter
MKNVSLLKYSVASAGDSAMYSYVNTFWLFYLTTVAGVAPAAAGAVTAIGVAFQAVASPFFAACSDRFVHRLGRRRPFVIFSALPLGFFACLMFAKLPFVGPSRVAVLFLLGAGFWMLFAAFFIPHLAWGAEIATDYNDRTAIRTYAYVMYTVGFIIGNVVPTTAVERFAGTGLGDAAAWLCVTVIVAALSCGCILYTGLSAPEEPSLARADALPGFSVRVLARDYLQVLRLRPLRLLICAVMAYLVGNSMIVADRMYVLTLQLKLSGSLISGFMLAFGLLGIALAAPMMRLAQRFDKRLMLIVCLGVSGCLTAAARLVGVARFTLPALILLQLVYTVASTAYWQLMPAAFYDICEVDEYENAVKRAGTITSTLPMAQSLASAVGMQALGIWLQYRGFAAGAESQSPAALAAVFDCFTLVPGVLFAVSALFMLRFPITKRRFAEIKETLAARRDADAGNIYG